MVDRLKTLGRGAPYPAICAPTHLIGQLSEFGVPAVSPPPEFDPELYLIFTADHLANGSVLFCKTAVDKMQTQAIGAALALKAGDPVETALRSALITATWIKHGNPDALKKRQTKLVH